EAVEDREDEARMRVVPVRAEPVLEVVQVGGERVPREPRRPREVVAPAEVDDDHADDDGRDQAEPAAPPRPRRRRGERDALDGDGHQSRSPAMAVRTASRSTTPTTRPSSTAQTGRSLVAIMGTASRTVVATSTRGPPSSPGAGGRMIQRSVRTWLRGMSRTKFATYSSAGEPTSSSGVPTWTKR